MKVLKLALLCAGYAATDLYLLLGWFAAATPKATATLWHRLFGPLTFDLSPHPEGYGFAFLTLSCLATVAFMVVLVRMSRGALPADPDARDERR